MNALFDTTNTPQGSSKILLLEGTKFALFKQEDLFFQSCVATGQGSLIIPFVEYWAAFRRGYEQKVIGGAIRLLCARCFVDMPHSFQTSLPGHTSKASIITLGESFSESASKGYCPWCKSQYGILLWDHAPLGDITEQDMAALRELWHQRYLLWWSQNNRGVFRWLPRKKLLCSGLWCESEIARGKGYHKGWKIVCEQCAFKSTDAKHLSELRKDPDYFGVSELRRARNLSAGKWEFDQCRML